MLRALDQVADYQSIRKMSLLVSANTVGCVKGVLGASIDRENSSGDFALNKIFELDFVDATGIQPHPGYSLTRVRLKTRHDATQGEKPLRSGEVSALRNTQDLGADEEESARSRGRLQSCSHKDGVYQEAFPHEA